MITLQELKQHLFYDPGTGLFSRKVAAGGAKIGDRAGWDTGHGYRAIGLLGKQYLEHRLAWFYTNGEWPPNEIDHVDMNGANNRFNNLRLATRAQNNQNRRSYAGSSCRLKGVGFHKAAQKWRAYIVSNYLTTHLGLFDCPAAAHFAYVIEANKRFGEFARAS
jgi:hypothetical protein